MDTRALVHGHCGSPRVAARRLPAGSGRRSMERPRPVFLHEAMYLFLIRRVGRQDSIYGARAQPRGPQTSLHQCRYRINLLGRRLHLRRTIPLMILLLGRRRSPARRRALSPPCRPSGRVAVSTAARRRALSPPCRPSGRVAVSALPRSRKPPSPTSPLKARAPTATMTSHHSTARASPLAPTASTHHWTARGTGFRATHRPRICFNENSVAPTAAWWGSGKRCANFSHRCGRCGHQSRMASEPGTSSNLTSTASYSKLLEEGRQCERKMHAAHTHCHREGYRFRSGALTHRWHRTECAATRRRSGGTGGVVWGGTASGPPSVFE